MSADNPVTLCSDLESEFTEYSDARSSDGDHATILTSVRVAQVGLQADFDMAFNLPFLNFFANKNYRLDSVSGRNK